MRYFTTLIFLIAGGALWPSFILNIDAGEQDAKPAAAIAEETTLTVTVTNRDGRPVDDLKADSFEVYEDGRPQAISSIRHEDGPASIGLLLDNSGSTRDKRDSLVAAMLHLVEVGNPANEMFVINFADDLFLDQDFTSDRELVRKALERGRARGGTSMYDAVGLSAQHLEKSKYQRRVLVVIADGQDNESHVSYKQAIQDAQYVNGPSIYFLALSDHNDPNRSKKEMEELAKSTGGTVIFPKSVKDLNAGAERIMRQIRGQYLVTYKPDNPLQNGGYRELRVSAHGTDNKGLRVSVKTGYFAGQKRDPQ
jgi:VWFA-related protein